MIILQILFWLCVWGLFHSYVFYPLLLKVVASNKANNQEVFASTETNLPHVSLVMSLFNEETVIEEKMQTLIATDYPQEKLNILVGSDCSEDATNSMVTKIANQKENIHFYPFEQRRGKSSVINDLVAEAQTKVPSDNHILIISDANVMLEKNTIYHLAKHFKNEKIGLVDSNILPPKSKGLGKQGIVASEKNYISREVFIKNLEGRAWGRTMGPLGGCYAIRAKYFEPVPAQNLVDDFYIAMKVFEKGGLAINDLEAVCYESIPNKISEEFRRKTRISAGNFFNLATFKHLLWPPFSSMSFTFLSHKVLRWLGPFFILIAFISLALLGYYFGNLFYQILFMLMSFGLFGIPILDWAFRQINLNVVILRYITYFNAMNLALFNGFFKYLKGGQNGIWKPTKRED